MAARSRLAASLGVVCALALGTAWSSAAANTEGRTTVEQTIVPAGEGAFRPLALAAGEPYLTREEGIGSARAGREERRLSLLYFGQLTDFQLADEESPARVEIADAAGPPLDAAWRPTEALGPHTTDAAIRQVNAFAARSPLADSSGRRAPMALTLVTGDNADNQQRNETEWVVRLLEGGELTPNSGIEPDAGLHRRGRLRRLPAAGHELLRPRLAAGDVVGVPRLSGPARPRPAGLPGRRPRRPSYVTFGNHDALAQGNQAANAAFEDIATGSLKIFGAGLARQRPARPGAPVRGQGAVPAALLGRRPRATATASGWWTVPSAPTRAAPPATTPSAQGRASASSQSTPSATAAWPGRRPTATSTTPSSAGWSGSSSWPRSATSWWSCSATTHREPHLQRAGRGRRRVRCQGRARPRREPGLRPRPAPVEPGPPRRGPGRPGAPLPARGRLGRGPHPREHRRALRGRPAAASGAFAPPPRSTGRSRAA